MFQITVLTRAVHASDGQVLHESNLWFVLGPLHAAITGLIGTAVYLGKGKEFKLLGLMGKYSGRRGKLVGE